MEKETIKEPQKRPQQQHAVVVVSGGKSKLRYPLRSATKSKDEKPPVNELSTASASRRRRTPASAVSKSVGVLDLSSGDRSGKPPKRLSIPSKSAAHPLPRTARSITPIPEAGIKRSNNGQSKSETPFSEISRASSRKRFSALSSTSYWLSQIKLSESAAKHSISLGFFNLAIEAGCQPLQRMRDDLKSYVRRHDLGEIGESLKELFETYNISDNQEQVQVSETCSHVPEEGIRSSDDEVHSLPSTTATRKLRPRALNADAVQVPTVAASANKVINVKNTTAARMRAPSKKGAANARSVHKSERIPQKPTKQETGKDNDRIKRQGKKAAPDKVSPSAAVVAASEEDKENAVALPTDDISLTEA